MDYRQAYLSLIARAKQREAKDLNSAEKYEWHHYFPVCFWQDKKNNIKTVPLTLREHWLAHRLLFKMFPCKGTAAALVLMSGRAPNMSSRKFESIRAAVHEYHWTKTEEGRYFLSEQMKRRWANGDFNTEKARQAWFERGRSLQRQWREHGGHPLLSDAARQESSERAKARNREMNAWLNKEKGKVERVCDKCGVVIRGTMGNMKQHQRGRKCLPPVG
jgi:hypothetical protein